VDDETSGRGLRGNRPAAFCIAGLMALTLVGAGSWLWGQRTGTRRAVEDARARTETLAAQILRANVVAGLRSDDPAAGETIDRLVSGQGDDVVGVTLRTAEGEAVYAQDSAALGQKVRLSGIALSSLRSGVATTELKLSADPWDSVLRVYQQVGGSDGGALLLVMDYRYASITADGRRTWQSFAPVTLGALVLMAVLWLSLAGLAALRGRRGDGGELPAFVPEQPDRWLELEPEPAAPAPAFSPPSRVRPAREPAHAMARTSTIEPEPEALVLDDDGWLGTIQGGTPWPAVPFTEPVSADDVALPGALRDGDARMWARADVLPEPSPDRAEAYGSGPQLSGHDRRIAGEPVHRGDVRVGTNGHGGMSDITSSGPNTPVGSHGISATNHVTNGNGKRRSLETALSGMLLPLARRGIDTRLDLPPGLQLPDSTEELLIRAAEEAVRHSVSHAEANTVKVRLDVRDQRVELTIDDDGRGFDPAEASRGTGARGHFGLRTLTRLAADAGGALHVRSSPDRGTRLHLYLPAV
jgi:hypothetical protein